MSCNEFSSRWPLARVIGPLVMPSTHVPVLLRAPFLVHGTVGTPWWYAVILPCTRLVPRDRREAAALLRCSSAQTPPLCSSRASGKSYLDADRCPSSTRSSIYDICRSTLCAAATNCSKFYRLSGFLAICPVHNSVFVSIFNFNT